ncbi:MAG: hypothetical protein Q8R37_03910 [Nanoarchaeota archaeon]|nr:hypothetical protein [Nanoarchaeota archaeon]
MQEHREDHEHLGNLQEIIAALQEPSLYPHPTKDIKIITTAVSHVFLTGNFAYKINKALNLGFLDFSTLEKRKEQCEKELKHNSLLSPELYEDVIPILKDDHGKIILTGQGEVIEYALKMKQMNPDSTMNNLLKDKMITEKQITLLAEQIFQFHQIAPQDKEIRQFGSVTTIQFNWDENFSQTEKYKPKIIASEDFNFIQEKINDFIIKNNVLFNTRVANKKIKHCHGDFHSANVFIDNNKIFIFDGIVFNKRFPCSDIIAEIAFMAMDLEFHHREDLAAHFIQRYQQLSNDTDIPALLDFYKCYRAYIRAKIHCFTTEDKNLNAQEKQKTTAAAQSYFQLAKKYAANLD